MGKLEWTIKNDVYGDYFSADTGMGGEYVIQVYSNEAIGLLDEHAELFYAEKTTVDEVKAACQRDYDVRLDTLALANGYVKLADDEIVMSRVMARYLIAGGCECCEDEGLSDCGVCEIKPIRDRIEEARDE